MSSRGVVILLNVLNVANVNFLEQTTLTSRISVSTKKKSPNRNNMKLPNLKNKWTNFPFSIVLFLFEIQGQFDHLFIGQETMGTTGRFYSEWLL